MVTNFIFRVFPALFLCQMLEGKGLCEISKVQTRTRTNSHADKLVKVFMEENYQLSAKSARGYAVDLEEAFGSGKYEFEILGISCLRSRCVAYTSEGRKEVGDYVEDIHTAEDRKTEKKYIKRREKIYKITFIGIFLPSKTIKFKSKDTRWKQ